MGNKSTKGAIVPLPSTAQDQTNGFQHEVDTAREIGRKSDSGQDINSKASQARESIEDMEKNLPTTTSRMVNGLQFFGRYRNKIQPKVPPSPLDKNNSVVEGEESNKGANEPPSTSSKAMKQRLSDELNKNLWPLQPTSSKGGLPSTFKDPRSPSPMDLPRRDLSTNVIIVPASSLMAISGCGMGLCISTNNSTSQLLTKGTPSTLQRSQPNSVSSNLMVLSSNQTINNVPFDVTDKLGQSSSIDDGFCMGYINIDILD